MEPKKTDPRAFILRHLLGNKRLPTVHDAELWLARVDAERAAAGQGPWEPPAGRYTEARYLAGLAQLEAEHGLPPIVESAVGGVREPPPPPGPLGLVTGTRPDGSKVEGVGWSSEEEPTRDYHRTLQRRSVLAFAVLMAVFWGGVILLGMCSSCAPRMASASPRSIDEQAELTVKVEGPCGDGSGVIVAPDRILTAKHLTECVVGAGPGGPIVISQPSTIYTITLADGGTRYASLDVAIAEDIARLKLTEGTMPGRPPRVGRGTVGDRVCAVTGHPARGRTCGTLTEIKPGSPVGGLEFTAGVRPGNSGSPLYDDWGRLLGIVVWCKLDRPGGSACAEHGGMATALVDRAWVVSP